MNPMAAELVPTDALGYAVLLATTAGVAVVHTLAGPDHYLPFIALGRARRWSTRRTVAWTSLCGAGHVASSIVIAAGAVVFGYGLERVELIEEFRGSLAAWLMIAFGAVYCAWGLTRAFRGRSHAHEHAHEDGEFHAHAHTHGGAHLHAHAAESGLRVTPWVLFTIFVLGPCEPMIPLVMYPAAQGEWGRVLAVSVVFGALTVGAMLATVLLAVRGIRLLPLQRLDRFAHATAGALVLGAGCAIQFLGL